MKGIDLGEVHPNSVKMFLTGESGKELEIVAASIGGGRIQICELDGLTANFSGDYPTLIVHNVDQPGHVTEVTSMLAHKSVNIATMQLYRKSRGGDADDIANAAALALKSLLGLACDPVAGLVEVPCVKRNVLGAVNAVSFATIFNRKRRIVLRSTGGHTVPVLV